ncbi:MAG: VCBS repeat-containing protein [Saprospiraceae bacterium]
MYSRATLLCGFFSLLTFSGISQSFSTFSSGTGVFYPTSDWADFNNDGYLDLLVTGNTGSSNVNSNPNPGGATLLYQNQNGTGFTEVQSTLIPGLPALSNSAVAWGDFNQDGWIDFAISGNQGGVKKTLLYKNNGPDQNFSFSQTTNWFPGLEYGSISWNDFNNDGYPDLFLSGLDSLKQERSLLFSNNGPDQGFSFSQLNTALIGFQKGSSDWADYNHDGFDDLLLTGINKTYTTLNSNNHTSTPYLYGGTLIYTNFGNGEFQLASFNCNPNGNGNLGYLGNAVWGDFNNDGYADLISVGSEYGSSALFKNNQNGSFSAMNGTGIPALNTGRARCADYNNDGWLDLAITGMGASQGGLFTLVENVYINNKNNTFSGTSNAGLAYVYYSDLNWADFDNNGHLDLPVSCGCQ